MSVDGQVEQILLKGPHDRDEPLAEVRRLLAPRGELT